MKAFSLTQYAGPSGLAIVEAEPPCASHGELVVEVEAVGINYPDLLMTHGRYQLRPALPVIPGCELAGIVRQAGAAAWAKPGDRVAAFVWSGSYAELAVVPATVAVPIPDDMPATVAVSLMVNYHTAYFGLAERAGLQTGETVLVLGAAGGIGTASIQVAVGLGAQVVAGVADTNQLATARAAGAHHALVLGEGFSGSVRELIGDGVDVVIDPLGDWLTLEGVRSLRPMGRLVTIGFVAGDIPSIKLNRLLLNNVAVIGAAWGAALDLDPALLRRGSEAIATMWRSGAVRPIIDREFEFADIPGALSELEQGSIRGKAVALTAAGHVLKAMQS